jgi:diacylglycerol kinase (ATP)
MRSTRGAPASVPPSAARRGERPGRHRFRRAGSPGGDLFVVVNGSASRGGDADGLCARLTRRLRVAGARAEGVVTPSEAALAGAVDLADGRRVVLVGGDGSINSAVNLARPPRELAIVPSGRANNVARGLGIPLALEEAAVVAAEARARPLDVLRVATADTSLYAVEALSAGLQADARGRYTADNSGDLAAGASAIIDALRRYRPYRLTLVGDGEEVFAGPAAQVFLSNLPLFGFGFRVNPRARPDDGMLEAIVLEAASRRQAVTRLAMVHRGRHVGRDWARARSVRSARIEGSLPLVADSHPLGTGGATVTVARGRLRLAAP